MMYKNKDDLTIHEHEDHVDRSSIGTYGLEKRNGQSEESFPCVSCDKVFDKLDVLDDHYAETAHDIDDEDDDIED